MRQLLRSLVALVAGLALGSAVAACAGENPWHIWAVLAKGAFGSRNDVGMTLFYSTPLIFTGLSVAMAFHAGLFNIGAEGQLTMGALAAAAAGALLPGVPAFLAPWVAGGLAFLGGAVWGAVPGWLRARRGSHEVITTMMFNFIAAGISSYVALHPLANPDSQNPETRPIGSGYLLAQWPIFGGAPLGWALPLALLAAAACWLFLWRTASGYELRVVGQSEAAAGIAGISPGRVRIMALTLAGGLAGLVGVVEVLGNSGRFKPGFSPQYGAMGIAVALLGKNHPAGVVAAALLFGALHKGSADLDMETEHITRDMALILQALVILSVCADGLWGRIGRGRVNPG